MYAVACQCFFVNTEDTSVLDEKWQEAAQGLRETNPSITEGELDKERINWSLLEGKRFYIPNSFDFTLETVSVYTNDELLKKACEILLERLGAIKDMAQTDTLTIEASDTTIDNCYDITLENEDYTIGNMLQYIMFKELHENSKVLSFCGFKKFHPHDSHSILRMALVNDEPKQAILEYIVSMVELLGQQVSNIMKEFQAL